jgi:hypothetical protein
MEYCTAMRISNLHPATWRNLTKIRPDEREVRHKRMHPLEFHLYEVQRQDKLNWKLEIRNWLVAEVHSERDKTRRGLIL